MDSMLIWMLIFAGATIGLLAIFLIASERELKIKRRDIERLAANLADSGGSGSHEGNMAREHADLNTIAQLENTNNQLREENSVLAHKLEANENQLREFDDQMRRLGDIELENHRLSAHNRQLLDEIERLKSEIQQEKARDNLAHSQEQAWQDEHIVLKTELTELRAELAKSQARGEELDGTKAQLASAETREQEVRDRCLELATQLGELKEQLADSREQMAQSDALQNQLHDVEEQYEQARAENQRLREENSRWQERLAASSETERRIGLLRHRLDELHTKQAGLAQQQRIMQEDTLALAKLLEDAPEISHASMEPFAAYESTTSSTTLTTGGCVQDPTETPSLDTAKSYIDTGRYQDALRHLDLLLKDAPNERELRLYHLLASVRLYRVDGYEGQIDAITGMADLSDSERLIARDLFLARAEEAQKRGRDDEMLRYRVWAKNVIYHAPFGSSDHEAPTHIGGLSNGIGFAPGRVNDTSGDAALSVTAAKDGTGEPNSSQSGDGKNRLVIFAAFIGILVIAGAIFAWSSGERAQTAGPVSGSSVQEPGVNSKSDMGKSETPTANEPTAAGRESPAVDAPPKKENLQSRPSGNLRDGAEKKPDVVALASKKNQHIEPPATREQERTAKQTQPAVNVPQGFRGPFEVVRPTQVLSEPRVDSPLIASIDPGTRVNVVADRDGWLEIRSKYGRPPGFIPKESAVRIQKH